MSNSTPDVTHLLQRTIDVKVPLPQDLHRGIKHMSVDRGMSLNQLLKTWIWERYERELGQPEATPETVEQEWSPGDALQEGGVHPAQAWRDKMKVGKNFTGIPKATSPATSPAKEKAREGSLGSTKAGDPVVQVLGQEDTSRAATQKKTAPASKKSKSR